MSGQDYYEDSGGRIVTRCKRCDPDAQCGTCYTLDQRNTFCWCGHTRTLHHSNLACLATMAGDLCPCVCFEEREEVA